MEISVFTRCLLRCYAEYEHMIVVRSLCRIFQLKTFMADVPDIATRLGKLSFFLNGRSMLCFAQYSNSSSRDWIFQVLHGAMIFISGAGLDAKLETNLIVSFTGSTVADGNSAFLLRDINEDLRDQRAGHCGTEEILVLVGSVCFYARSDVLVAEFIDNMLDI